jgi:hypothetical protein
MEDFGHAFSRGKKQIRNECNESGSSQTSNTCCRKKAYRTAMQAEQVVLGKPLSFFTALSKGRR